MKLKPYPSQEQLQALFDYDRAGLLLWKVRKGKVGKPGKVAGSVNVDGYRRIQFDGNRYMAHRLIWIWHHGPVEDALCVDHINGERNDNRIENLQILTQRQNTSKGWATSKSSSLPTGVTLTRYGTYQAALGVAGAKRHLGSFATKDEARLRYQQELASIEESNTRGDHH